jgi:hypothetical protein
MGRLSALGPILVTLVAWCVVKRGVRLGRGPGLLNTPHLPAKPHLTCC